MIWVRPSNSVLGYAQLLANEQLSENGRRRLNIIVTQVERMVAILNQRLSQARGFFQDHRRVELNALIQETLDLFRPTSERNGIRVIATLAKPLPTISGDETSLQRVLINLLDNAVDALEKGGAITVSTSTGLVSETGASGVTLTVTDTGAGIPPELLPKIFEFFVTTKAEDKGTGLGMAICHEIIKRHRGTSTSLVVKKKGRRFALFSPLIKRLTRKRPLRGEQPGKTLNQMPIHPVLAIGFKRTR